MVGAKILDISGSPTPPLFIVCVSPVCFSSVLFFFFFFLNTALCFSVLSFHLHPSGFWWCTMSGSQGN